MQLVQKSKLLGYLTQNSGYFQFALERGKIVFPSQPQISFVLWSFEIHSSHTLYKILHWLKSNSEYFCSFRKCVFWNQFFNLFNLPSQLFFTSSVIRRELVLTGRSLSNPRNHFHRQWLQTFKRHIIDTHIFRCLTWILNDTFCFKPESGSNIFFSTLSPA